MSHYRSNLRDIEFNLFEVFGTQHQLGQGPFAQMDEESARGVLVEIERLATGVLADAYADGDRNPPVFDPDTGTVELPKSYHRALDAFREGEWFRLDLPEHLGGFGAPPSLRWAANEMLLGSNAPIFMYASGSMFAKVLDGVGTDEQRARIVLPMVEHSWGATMVLTEPDAGSDVGAGRTKAIEQADGSWHIEGVKRFITSGEFDWPDNIVHFVLARPVGAGPGTKGLSLFICPKYWVEQDGSIGARNGVMATNLEHKMGLRGSATCELTFGAGDVPARALLVGEVHDGIAQMFRVIENARMMVGTKAIATLSTGYLTALDYAKSRVQGADLTRLTDKSAPRVTITHHPDVRRMLMTQKAHAEGMRALVLYTATIQDMVALGGAEADDYARLNDLLLPIVKGYGSEKSYALLSEALQVLGGSGYLQDYPIEQYLRDAKIDTLYEGTTSIQGIDLFFRKVVRDQGNAVRRLLTDIAATAGKSGDLQPQRAALGTALADVQAMLEAMGGFLMSAQDDPRNVYKVGLTTTDLLMSLGDLLVGWLLVRQAEVASNALSDAPARDRAFYIGKIAAATWFCAAVLPALTARRQILAATDLLLMDLDEAAF